MTNNYGRKRIFWLFLGKLDKKALKEYIKTHLRVNHFDVLGYVKVGVTFSLSYCIQGDVLNMCARVCIV